MVDIDNMPRAIGADYSAWHADSKITLTNVPWDNNYRDIVQFPNQAALNKYIDGKKSRNVDVDSARYYRISEPIRLEIPFTEAYGYNYVRVLNPAQSVVGNEAQYSYYFIIGVSNTAAGVTTVTVQLDVWQTFGHLIKFGNSYVETGHIGIANKDGFNNWGRDFLTLSEGLDSGSELKVTEVRYHSTMRPDNANILVISTVDLTSDPGTQKNPNLDTAQGSNVFGTPSGADYLIFTSTKSFTDFVKRCSKYPWKLQGIQSITAIPDMRSLGYKYQPVGLLGDSVGSNSTVNRLAPVDVSSSGTYLPRGRYRSMWDNWREEFAGKYIPKRYRHLKKFFTSPYMAIEMTYHNGAPVVLKPELWANDNAIVAEKVNIVAPGQRAVMYPRKYNAISDAPYEIGTHADGDKEYFQDGGEYLSVSAMVSNFPTFAVVANGGVLALANQAHSLAQQYKTMDWSQNKALAGNQNSYDQATAANNNMQANAMIGRNAAIDTNAVANQQNVARTGVGIASGVASGLTAGPQGLLGSAIAGGTAAVNTALDIQQRNANLGIANAANVGQTANDAETANFMRDTNKSLSDWSARGDYRNSVATLNAKVQDTAMTAPFTAGQAGGDTFNYVFDKWGVACYFKWKFIPPSELRAVGEYWLRYGYDVRQFYKIPASLHVMTKFSYWKLTETYLSSANVPEFIKQMIRGIFEKGVTVWVNPDDIGNIDVADNAPLPNISLGNKL